MHRTSVKPAACYARAAIEALRGLADGLKAQSGEESARAPSICWEGELAGSPIASRAQALAAGYTGDACSSCGSFAMKQAGACLSCDICGASSGCS